MAKMTEQVEHQMNKKIIIRLATVADARRLAASRFTFRSRLNPAGEDEEAFVERCSRWMQARLREDRLWKCWLAEQASAPCGHLWMQLIEKIPNPIREPEYHAYITNVYVDEAARGQGIGSRLLTEALDWAKAQDVHAVILWPTEKSRSLYARHGFAVREDVMEFIVKEVGES